MAYTRPSATAADFSFAGLAAYTRPAATGADLSFAPGTAEGAIACASPLGAALVLATFAVRALASANGPLQSPAAIAASSFGSVAAASPLGAARVTASFPVVALCAAASPLGAALAKAFHDFSALLGDTVTRYVMDLTTPDGAVRVPISSWQATLQTGASNYVQCVVPAVADWTAAINAATAFTITRTAEPAGLPVIEYEMASAPLETISIAQGPTNYTATLSGYSPAFAVDEAPPAATDRTLIAVRSVTTTSGKMRARCAIDWTLRPAQRAYLPDGASFIVSYINFYQPQGNDSYMDVGE